MYGFNSDKSRAAAVSAERLIVKDATVVFPNWIRKGSVGFDALTIPSPASLGYTGVNVLAVSAKEPNTGKWADLPFPAGVTGWDYKLESIGFTQETSGASLILTPYRSGDVLAAVTVKISVVILYV